MTVFSRRKQSVEVRDERTRVMADRPPIGVTPHLKRMLRKNKFLCRISEGINTEVKAIYSRV